MRLARARARASLLSKGSNRSRNCSDDYRGRELIGSGRAVALSLSRARAGRISFTFMRAEERARIYSCSQRLPRCTLVVWDKAWFNAVLFSCGIVKRTRQTARRWVQTLSALFLWTFPSSFFLTEAWTAPSMDALSYLSPSSRSMSVCFPIINFAYHRLRQPVAKFISHQSRFNKTLNYHASFIRNRFGAI